MAQPAPQPNPPTTSSRRPGRRLITVLVVLALAAAYFGSGFYLVQPNERGVVRWFGAVPESQCKPPYGVGPGVHYALPWPICQVKKPRTTEVRRVFVGMPPEMREAIARGDTQAMLTSSANDVFTGDVNILKVTMAVQYQVIDPIAYLFETENPDLLVQATVQSVLIDRLAELPVDEALTTAKAKLENDTRAAAQELLTTYGSGVRLVATNIETIEPPRAIIAAFQDVVSAKKDGEKAIDRARAEAYRILPRARGEAAEIVEDAQAYHESRISRASGEADRFLALLAEYQRAPDVTRRRLWFQTVERVLPVIRKVIVDNRPNEPPANVRIIDKSPE